MRWKHVRNVFGSKSLYSLKKCFLPLYRSRLILPFLIKCRTFACRNILDVMNYGFVKVAASVPQVKVADCRYNASQIEKEIIIAEGKGVQVIVFPELCLTAYT